MQEEQPWLLGKHVTMDRSHVDAILPQRLDHGIHFVTGQNKISCYGGLTATGRLGNYGSDKSHRPDRSDFHSAFHDWIAARHGQLIDAAVGLALGANDLIELSRIEID